MWVINVDFNTTDQLLVKYHEFIWSSTPMKLVELIKMSLKETFGKSAYVNICNVSYS
jgi:hypothetical protein